MKNKPTYKVEVRKMSCLKKKNFEEKVMFELECLIKSIIETKKK